MCGDALSAAIVLVSRWPDTFSATSITLILSESMIATMRLIASGVPTLPGCPCTSMAGNLAFGTLCSGTTSVLRGR